MSLKNLDIIRETITNYVESIIKCSTKWNGAKDILFVYGKNKIINLVFDREWDTSYSNVYFFKLADPYLLDKIKKILND